MSWNFRKRIQILPGIRINFSKSGLSTTIGPRGANVNLGSKGAFLNLGIPGTGIYSRRRIGAADLQQSETNKETLSNSQLPKYSMPELPTGAKLGCFARSLICGIMALINVILLGVVFYIVPSLSQLLENYPASFGLVFICVLWGPGLFVCHLIERHRELKTSDLTDIEFLEKQIQSCTLDETIKRAVLTAHRDYLNSLDIPDNSSQTSAKRTCYEASANLPSTLKGRYDSFVSGFRAFKDSNRVWRVQNGEFRIFFYEESELPYIKCHTKVPTIELGYSEKLYFYPTFIYYCKFSIITEVFSYNDFELKSTSRLSYKQGNWSIPNDCYKVIKKYAHVNKDGSPDLRYKNNPCTTYCVMSELHIAGKIHSVFVVSKDGVPQRIVSVFDSYKALIAKYYNCIKQTAKDVSAIDGVGLS